MAGLSPDRQKLVRRLISLQMPKDSQLQSSGFLVSGHAQDFVRIILLVSFCSFPQWDAVPTLDIVELYAGVARISRLGSWAGFRTNMLFLGFAEMQQPLSGRKAPPRSSASCPGHRKAVTWVASPQTPSSLDASAATSSLLRFWMKRTSPRHPDPDNLASGKLEALGDDGFIVY